MSEFNPNIRDMVRDVFTTFSVPEELFEEAVRMYNEDRTREVTMKKQAIVHSVAVTYLVSKKNGFFLDMKMIKEYLKDDFWRFGKVNVKL